MLDSNVNPKQPSIASFKKFLCIQVCWGLQAVSSRKKRYERPWWHSPTVNQILVTTDAMERCRLPPLIIRRIISAMAEKKYPSRPKRAKKNWLENLLVDGAKVYLSCHVEEEKIVVTNINVRKGALEKKKRRK